MHKDGHRGAVAVVSCPERGVQDLEDAAPAAVVWVRREQAAWRQVPHCSRQAEGGSTAAHSWHTAGRGQADAEARPG